MLINKGNNNKVRRQPLEWNKISVNYSSGKELISRMYNRLKEHNSNKEKEEEEERRNRKAASNLILNGQMT
jgi:hypothetical protein